jgi:hypothetical protein
MRLPSPLMFCVWRVTISAVVTLVSCRHAVATEGNGPTVAVPPVTVTCDVTGASKVKTRCRSWRYDILLRDTS